MYLKNIFQLIKDVYKRQGVDFVRKKVSTKQQILDVPPQSVITKDVYKRQKLYLIKKLK